MRKVKHSRSKSARPRFAPALALPWKLPVPAVMPDAVGQRREPLLAQYWPHLWPREMVELRSGDRVLGIGHVDESTSDGTIIWIHLTNGLGRVLIHHDDGIDIWRVDARVTEDRVQHASQKLPAGEQDVSCHPLPPGKDEPGLMKKTGQQAAAFRPMSIASAIVQAGRIGVPHQPPLPRLDLEG
jgi:hypothetical protein